MPKVGILYVCTGKYDIFWPDFYETAEMLLLPDCEKTYLVLTDAQKLPNEERANIKKFAQPHLGWPKATLLRYHMFRNIEHELVKYDYLFFFNANIVFQAPVLAHQLLPVDEDFVAVNHFFTDRNKFPYEKNPASRAYIPPDQGTHYFMGGINGGKASSYIEMIRTLQSWIQADLDRNLIAVVHDESYLNKYLLDKKVKVLGRSYGYPEELHFPDRPFVLIRDKVKWGGHGRLRSG